MHLNLLVGFVGLNYMNAEQGEADLQLWRGRPEKAKNLFLRPNLLGGGMGRPVN